MGIFKSNSNSYIGPIQGNCSCNILLSKVIDPMPGIHTSPYPFTSYDPMVFIHKKTFKDI